jgi:peptidoglycan lytic transglycosylase B
MTRARRWCVAVLLLVVGSTPANATHEQQDAAAPPLPSFTDWLQAVRTDALARGIKPSTLDIALIGLEPVPVVLERDRQ